jgi:hypothetical protein
MSKPKPARTTPRIAGSPVYGQDSLAALPGNSVYKHCQKYHVFVGVNRVMVTDDMHSALTEAARTRTP